MKGSIKNSENSKDDFIRDYRLKIAGEIRVIREKRGYSQDDLAKIIGVNRSTISKIENGKFSFSIDYLAKFSFFLDFNFSIVDNQIILWLDDPEYWQHLYLENLTDEECVDVLKKISSIYTEWNYQS